jgi:hypothetical protein
MTLITDKNVFIALLNSKAQKIVIENPAEAGVFKNINKLPTKNKSRIIYIVISSFSPS